MKNNIKNSIFNFRHLRAIGVVAVSIVVITMLTGSVLLYFVEKKAREKLASSNITYATLTIDLFSRSISLTNFAWSPRVDSTRTQPHRVVLKNISIQGIGIYNLLRGRELSINEIEFSDGYVRYNKSLTSVKTDTTASSVQFNGIEVDNLILRNVSINVLSDSIVKTSLYVNSLAIDALSIEKEDRSVDDFSYHLKRVIGLVQKVKIGERPDRYRLEIAAINFNDESISMDSVAYIPTVEKYQFAREVGKQVTRVDATIPKVVIHGLALDKLFDSTFTARKIELQNARIVAFRDKRLPFKNPHIPLPMESFSNLPVGVEIDSVTVKNMHVTVEEFPEEGQAPGSVFFENLDAVFLNFNNRYYANKSPFATIHASALFMGKGKIDATFHLPIDGSPTYRAKGRIENMPLASVNTMLENMAHIRIETGQLKEMIFSFNYNDQRSQGELEINYEDLKMVSLNNDKAASTNEFKTFLINTVIKNDKNEKTKEAKRTGAIAFERDQRKFIFNFWWKSLLSGIKSSVLGIELPAKDSPKKKNGKPK